MQLFGAGLAGFVFGFVIAATRGDKKVLDEKMKHRRACEICKRVLTYDDDIFVNPDNWGSRP